MTRYGFARACGGFFRGPAAALAASLPEGLHLLETHPGFGVLALTFFDFDDSEVGPYREWVCSVLVRPWAPRGRRLPDAALFPIQLATTTEASRRHAATRWRLPELDRCLSIDIASEHEWVHARVLDEGTPVLELRVATDESRSTKRVYQCFSTSDGLLHRVEIDIDGMLFEHEDERGELHLHDHELAHALAPMLDDPIPFREQSMGRGEQRFGELRRHDRSDAG